MRVLYRIIDFISVSDDLLHIIYLLLPLSKCFSMAFLTVVASFNPKKLISITELPAVLTSNVEMPKILPIIPCFI